MRCSCVVAADDAGNAPYSAVDYVIEANLTDYDQNFDGNGSNNTGPDLVIKLSDVTPPVISRVDSVVGADDDELYETNSLVQLQVFEMLGEPAGD